MVDNVNVVITNADREVQDAIACAVFNTMTERGFVDVEVMRPDPANPGNAQSVNPGEEQSLFDQIESRNPHVFGMPVRIWTNDILRPKVLYPEYDRIASNVEDPTVQSALRSIESGVVNPYDGIVPDRLDYPRQAALGILCGLSDRRGVGNELEAIDDDLRKEIVDELSATIAVATSAIRENDKVYANMDFRTAEENNGVEQAIIYLKPQVIKTDAWQVRVDELKSKYPDIVFKDQEHVEVNEKSIIDIICKAKDLPF